MLINVNQESRSVIGIFLGNRSSRFSWSCLLCHFLQEDSLKKTVRNQAQEILKLKEEKIILNRENRRLQKQITNNKKLHQRKLHSMTSVATQTRKASFPDIKETGKKEHNKTDNQNCPRQKLLSPFIVIFCTCVCTLMLNILMESTNCTALCKWILSTFWTWSFTVCFITLSLIIPSVLFVGGIFQKGKSRFLKYRKSRQIRKRNRVRKRTKAKLLLFAILLPFFTFIGIPYFHKIEKSTTDLQSFPQV